MNAHGGSTANNSNNPLFPGGGGTVGSLVSNSNAAAAGAHFAPPPTSHPLAGITESQVGSSDQSSTQPVASVPLPGGAAGAHCVSSLPSFSQYVRPAFASGCSSTGSPVFRANPVATTPSSLLQSGAMNVGVIRPFNRPPVADQAPITTAGATGVMTNQTVPVSGASSVGPGLTGAGQRLKVEDALSYLDQVKMVFATRAQVYSDFLDIMKDFKSQAIDTPGVIHRVSSLFRGHPSLIVGFNTFLPPGYRIDVDSTGERVSICTPSGQSHVIAPAAGPDGAHKMEMTTSSCPVVTSHQVAESLVHQQQQTVSPRPPSAPIEFNHAISYVNKIKGRFQHKPEVYKHFLEILHSYQKEQRDMKSGTLPVSHKPLTESAVYASVARLFANEEDLLREFSQFLPDATGPGMISSLQSQLSAVNAAAMSQVAVTTAASEAENCTEPKASASPAVASPKQHPLPPAKRPATKAVTVKSEPSQSPPKKQKKTVTEISYTVSFAEAAKYGTLSEYQFFDKVRKALKSDEVYENFLRCLVLFNQEMISKSELLDLIQPFIGKYPELFKWIKDFMGCNERTGYVEAVTQKMAQQERISSDLAMEIDYASCKRFGVSYRALPDSYVRPKCSGRTELCDSVLNNVWVSFPSWSSEDSTFVSSKKSQYEEFIYRTEDERFELDIVIEVNRSAIQNLESVRRKLARMSPEEAKKFRLDENLGGRSVPLMKRAIRRIYGEKSADIIDGLQRNPSVAVPLVLKRLKAKDEEWREAQKGFNRIWRDQNEKYYLKSLDYQAMTFKQNDLKLIRSKALLNQIEVLYDERHEKMEEGVTPESEPHVTIKYPTTRTIFYDVSDLLIHHVKRQTAIQKEEKSKVKSLLRQKIPDLFGLEREELSDDEGDRDSEESDEKKRRSLRTKPTSDDEKLGDLKLVPSESLRDEPKVSCGYTLMFAPNPWYVFFRLHQLLCERLGKLKHEAEVMAKEKEEESKLGKGKSVAALLKCEPKLPCPPDQYYANLIGHVKNLLDGQIDNAQYEDNLRDMFSTGAFIAFTADKLVQNMVRQLQQMVSEEGSIQSQQLYHKWKAMGGAGGMAYYSISRQVQEDAYQSEAEQLMLDNNAFKIFFWHEDGKVSFELLDTDSCEEDGGAHREWSLYIQKFLEVLPTGIADGCTEELLKQLGDKPVFLLRNCRKVKQLNQISVSGEKEDGKMAEAKTERAAEGTTEPISGSAGGKPPKKMLKQEDLEIQLIPGKWGLKFVANTADLLWKRGAVTQSQLKHKEVYSKRKRRFYLFLEKWLSKNVSDTLKTQCCEWFIEAGEKSSKKLHGCFSDKFDYLDFTKYKTAKM